MIQSFYNLGVALQTKEEYAEYFATYAQPFNGVNKKGDDIVWVFPIINDAVTELEKVSYRQTHAKRYLFRKPKGARGAPLVATGPTYPVSDPQDEKKRDGHLENVEKLMSRIERSIPEGQSAYFTSTATRNAGLERVRQILENEPGTVNNRYIYTFKVEGDWLGDKPELVELLEGEAYAKYYEKSLGKNKTCSLTHEQGVEVWGRVDTLGFTVNDKAFSRGGFNAKDSYKMFPVSKPAVLALEGARRYVFEQLAGQFFPLEFLIIPRLIEGDVKDLLKATRTLSGVGQKPSEERERETLLGTSEAFDLIATRKELQRAGMLFDVLFFHRNQAQLALDLIVQDVDPLNVVRLKSTQLAINNLYGYHFGRNEKDGSRKYFMVNIRSVRNFFTEGHAAKIRLPPFFFRVMEGIFQGEPVDEPTFLAGLVGTLRETFKQRNENNYLPGQVRNAIAVWQWMATLGLFTNVKPIAMNEESKVVMNYEGFLTQHENFYGKAGTPLHGAFMLGILTGMLTYAQYKAINSKPFLNRVNNLKLGVEELLKLSSELMNKILEYQNRSTSRALLPYGVVNELFARANESLVTGGKYSRDQLSFAFATGLVMQQQFGLDKADQKKKDAAAETAA